MVLFWVIVAFGWNVVAAAAIQILAGITANQVIQQDGGGKGSIALRGRCP